MKIRPTSLPLQLLVFVVLPLLVLLVIVAFGGVALHQTAMRDMLVTHNDHVVLGAASSLSDQLAQRRALLTGLAFSPNDPEATQHQIETSGWLHTLFDGGVAVYSADGHRLAASPVDADWPPIDQQIAGQNLLPFIPLVEPGRNATRIAMWATANDLHIVGVVSLDALPLSDILMSLHESPTTDIYLLAAGGLVLYHSNPARVGGTIEAPPSTQESATHASGGHQDIVATVAQIPAAQWTLIQEERWQEALSPVMRYSQAAPLALVPGLLIAMGAMWFGIRRIVYPLRRLEGQAAQLAGGDFAAIEQPVEGINEIQHLQATLQHMARRVQAAQASMHTYIGAITRAQEDERQRVARELHDQTAQALVALGHRQQMLKPHLVDSPAAAELHAEIRRMIQETMDELRRIVRALRPIYLEELGLAPALQMLARDLGPHDNMLIHFEKAGEPRRLTPETEIALYRIAQEALTNARRHSGATQVWLSVQFAETQVEVAVRDDGKGFSLASQPASRHFGIMGMHERATLIGARLHIQSEPGTGTTVTVQAPIATAPNATV